MIFFPLSALVNAITSTIVSIIALVKNPKSDLNRSFCYFASSVALWSYCYFFWQLSRDANAALFWCRTLMGFAIFIPSAFFHFSTTLIGQRQKYGHKIIFWYCVSIIFLVLDFTPLFVKDVRPRLFFPFWPTAGIAYAPFLLMFIGLTLYSHILMFKNWKFFSGVRRNQIKYIFLGTAIGFLGGTTNYPLWYDIKIIPIGNIFVSVYVFLVFYAIIKFRLMDISTLLVRVSVFLIVYATVLGVPFYVGYKYGLWKQATWAMLVLATLGPFIYLALQRRAEKIILKAQKTYQAALREISFTMINIKDLDLLLNNIVLKVVSLVSVTWAAIYFFDEKQKKFILKHQSIRLGNPDLMQEYSFNSPLVESLNQSREPLIGEEIGLSSPKIGLAVPCFIDNDLVCFLLLGDKPKNAIFTQDDASVFTVLSSQTALAIQNCQFYSQERQRQQYMRVASLDRQMAGLAHEIDNPNSALLGSLGSLELVLDDLKEVIPTDKMEYLKKKIERARFNSKRISKMITSVREFSRASTGEVIPIKFEWIMEGLLNIIEPQFKYNGVNFIQELPNEEVWLRANKVEIEQVLVNLGTNSTQAINEIWLKGQNSPESKKEITLRAYKTTPNTLRIDFSDTGGGIKKELLEDIFLDFVTTKGSAEGTGLGLSISRKIIQKHNGKIWAESEGENKGATFYIELPIANDLSKEEKHQAEVERGGQGKKDMFIQDFPK